MTRRYELTEAQYALIEDLLPRNGRRGNQWEDHRQVLNGIFWILNSGAQWRELPERYGNWNSVYQRFSRWSRSGLIARILERLQLKLNTEGFIDHELWLVDSTIVRASRSAAGARREKTGEAFGMRKITRI